MISGISPPFKHSSSVYDTITNSLFSPKVAEFIQDYDFSEKAVGSTLKSLRYRVLILTAFGQWVDLVYRVGFYLRQFVLETGDYFIFKRVEYYKDYKSAQAMLMAYIFRTLSICADIVKATGYSTVIISLTGESLFFHPLKAALRLQCLYDKLNGVSISGLTHKTGDETTLNQEEGNKISQIKGRKCVETPFSGRQYLTELEGEIIPGLQAFLTDSS